MSETRALLARINFAKNNSDMTQGEQKLFSDAAARITELEAENARLTQRLKDLAVYAYARDDLIIARDRIKALEVGLKPFAEISAAYDPDDGDDEQPVWDRKPNIGMLRRARALITRAAAKPTAMSKDSLHVPGAGGFTDEDRDRVFGDNGGF